MERKFEIITDITCDLGPELRKQFGIDYMLGHLTTPDGKEHDSKLEWKSDEERSNFYFKLRKNPAGFTTAPASEEEWKNRLEEYVKQGKDVMILSLSSTLSLTYGLLEKAAIAVQKAHPERKIIAIDSRRFGAGVGIIALHAATLRNQGKDIEEVASWLKENLNHFHQAGWLDDLSFVAKKGRISSAAAFFGTLVGIKPIGEFDKNGMTTVLGKAKGEKQAYNVLLNYIEKTIINLEEQIILVSTADRKKNAEAYKKMIEDRFHPKAVYLDYVYPSSGINVGPGLMSAYYYGKPISDDLTEEKSLIEELLKIK